MSTELSLPLDIRLMRWATHALWVAGAALFLVFGIAFEVPIAVIVLVRIGVVSIEKLRQWRGYFIVASFVIAAVVTPPDVISQLALAIPMCILYEIGIIAAQMIGKRSANSDGDGKPSS